MVFAKGWEKGNGEQPLNAYRFPLGIMKVFSERGSDNTIGVRSATVHFKTANFRESPGGPVVRTPCFHC